MPLLAQRVMCSVLPVTTALQLVGELRGALAAAAEKVDEMEERERATAASHKQIVRPLFYFKYSHVIVVCICICICIVIAIVIAIVIVIGSVIPIAITFFIIALNHTIIRWSRRRTRVFLPELNPRCRFVSLSPPAAYIAV